MQEELNKVWGRWKIDKLLGEGSFGKVYRIEKEEFGHTYEAALKVIRFPQNEAEIQSVRNDGMDEDSVREYFKGIVEDIVSEFVLMSKLKGNTNIVSYEDHVVVPHEDKVGWTIYIRMELLSSLFEYLKEKPLSIRDVIRLGIDICSALEVCQTYNIIHRDIKPENIFVSNLGHFKLGDFGIARQLEKTTSGLSKKGTYSYMAPEVYKGEEYNSTVDIYSLGIVLYRFLNNNRTPFLPEYPTPIRYEDREKANVLRMSGVQMQKPCLAEGRLAEIILKACAYNPKDRYESAADMKKALESVLYEEALADVAYPSGDKLGNQKFVYTSSAEKKQVVDKENHKKKQKEQVPEKNYNENTMTLYPDSLQYEEKKKAILQAAEEERKKKSKTGLFIVLGLITVVVIGIFGMKSYQESLKREVPSIANMTIEEAMNTTELEIVEAASEYSDTVEKGDIISQNIEPGTVVTKDASIEVIVSKGALVEVPSLVGKSTKKAQELLEEAGLVMEISKKKYSDKVDNGDIISQNPKKGEKLEENQVVTVVVSKGIEQVEVPDVTGKDESKAKDLLKDAKLKYEVSYDYSSSVDKGNVISQSIDSGKKVDKNTTVKIVISDGPKPVPVSKPTYNSSSNSSSKKNDSSNNDSYDDADSIDEWDLVN